MPFGAEHWTSCTDGPVGQPEAKHWTNRTDGPVANPKRNIGQTGLMGRWANPKRNIGQTGLMGRWANPVFRRPSPPKLPAPGTNKARLSRNCTRWPFVTARDRPNRRTERPNHALTLHRSKTSSADLSASKVAQRRHPAERPDFLCASKEQAVSV